jgi:dTDP-4-dehydrorhamnose reductase
MKIYVIGANGMLGKYVSTYLGKYYDLHKINRNQLDVSNTSESDIQSLFEFLRVDKNDVVINCAGTIKPRVDELGDLNAILVNSVFPRLLANVCEKLEIKLIHPTTDCVYSGNKGKYNEDDKYDVNDVYGMSKALGEPNNCTVIRTSIIGEEVNQGRSLIEWVKSEKNNTVFGFTNHYWNGVTCLQFAKLCHKIITDNLFWVGTRHLHSNTLNKKELVQLISDVFDLNLTITPKETDLPCDRSLSTKSNIIDLFTIPTLDIQIKEMKEFSNTLYNQ